MLARLKRRATTLGLIAGLAAALLWPAFSVAPAGMRLPFAAALALCAACGAILVAIAIADLLGIRRARSVLPARLFDLAIGLILATPTALTLADLLN